MKLVSFDIDGTMIFGVPPGPITPNLVRKAKEMGYLVGSASDRTIANQVELWKEHEVEVDFVSLKHRLPELKEKFEAARYLHIGDSDTDRYFAEQAGFEFLWVHQLPRNGEIHWL